MKLELYNPHKVGEVSLNPYQWTYSGYYTEVENFLSKEPELYKGTAIPSNDEDEQIDGEVKLTGKEYLIRLSDELKGRGIYDTVIVDG